MMLNLYLNSVNYVTINIIIIIIIIITILKHFIMHLAL